MEESVVIVIVWAQTPFYWERNKKQTYGLKLASRWRSLVSCETICGFTTKCEQSENNRAFFFLHLPICCDNPINREHPANTTCFSSGDHTDTT